MSVSTSHFIRYISRGLGSVPLTKARMCLHSLLHRGQRRDQSAPVSFYVGNV